MMSVQSFKTSLMTLEKCDRFPESAKKILNSIDYSINELNETDFKQLWILLHEFLKETLVLEDISEANIKLLTRYEFILNLIDHVIYNLKDIICVFKHEHLLNIILKLQNLYSKNINYELKLKVVKICLHFWKRALIPQVQKRKCLNFDAIMTGNFYFTFNYLFDAIEMTTTKSDMKTLSSLLREFSKLVSTLSNNKNGLNLFVLKLEKLMKHTMFLETETGRWTIADTFSSSQLLFQQFHQKVINNLPKANKLEADAYGDIYFISWIKSNASMRKVIELQGIFDLISKTIILQRTSLAFRTYHNALIMLQSIQNHRKHLIFSKVITDLFEPIIWKYLESTINMARCNATEMLVIVYPLEKIGESREVSSRYLIKQQDAIINLLEDVCPQVQVVAVNGISRCLRHFWNSFENDQIRKCFSLLSKLINESIVEVRRVVLSGLSRILEESKSHDYFMAPFFITLLKNALHDENQRVRHAFILFLLKVKRIGSEPENRNKINYAKIVDLSDIACALAREERQNTLLLIDLVFDNFIGEQVPNMHSTLLQFYKFYKINPIAFQKLMINSNKHLNFENACLLILSLLNTLNSLLEKKEEDHNITIHKLKINNDADNTNYTVDTSNLSISLCVDYYNNDDKNQDEHRNICCILDCVNCLMILHCDTFTNEINHQKMKEIQDSCTSCLVKLLKFYKNTDAFFCAMSLASLIPLSKLIVHISIDSAALFALQQLPHDIKLPEENIDMGKVNGLLYALCMWKQGYQILQFVKIWFDEAFKTLNLYDTRFPEESESNERKRARFKASINNCKPMTGIILINSMLINLQTQKSLMDSDVNKKSVYDLISYLPQRIKLGIENRIYSDGILNHSLSDEVLVELFQLYIRLHIIYHSHEKSSNIDEIIKQQTSILNWIKMNLFIHNLDIKNETTKIFVAIIVEVINKMVSHMCLMEYVNKTYLDTFFSYCTTVLHNHLGPWILTSMTTAFIQISKYFNYHKQINDPIGDTSSLINCVISIISVYSQSNLNEESFKSIIGDPLVLRQNLITLILEVYKIGMIEFNNVFLQLIEKVMHLTANRIREIGVIGLNEKLIEMPHAAYQLAMVMFSNPLLRKHFSLNAIPIFSSNIYKNDCVRLLSAIMCIKNFSSTFNQTESIEFQPIVKLLYTSLLALDNFTTTLSNNNCTINKTQVNQKVPILRTYTFNNEVAGFKKIGYHILISIAIKLGMNLY